MATPIVAPLHHADNLRPLIELDALNQSRLRKVRSIFLTQGLGFLDGMPDTQQDRDADWMQACAIWADRLMTVYPLSELDSAGFCHLEATWLEDVKRHLAYCCWVAKVGDNDYLLSETLRMQCYFEGCEELRDRLVRPTKRPIDHRAAIQYVKDRYLGPASVLDHQKAADLIARKAARLSWANGDPSERAKQFVRAFYGHIVPAVAATGRTQTDAILHVLKALRYEGGAPGEPGIVNAFEALLAILFIDGKVVQELWEGQEVARETTF